MTIIDESKDAFVDYIKKNIGHLFSVLEKGGQEDKEKERKRKVILSIMDNTISDEDLDKQWEKSPFFPRR